MTVVERVHKPECVEATKNELYAVWLYDSRWRAFCKACNGSGVLCWEENQSPLGSGYYWPMQFSEPCEECTGKGLCARCKRPGLTSEERGDDSTGDGPCTFCGWDYKDGGRPEEPFDDGYCGCFPEPEW